MPPMFKEVVPGLTLAQINAKNKALWSGTKDADNVQMLKSQIRRLEDKLPSASNPTERRKLQKEIEELKQELRASGS